MHIRIYATAALMASAAIANNHFSASSRDLEASLDTETGYVFEAWLSPYQEGSEDKDTSPITSKQFKSTTPSVDRNRRPSHGYGTLTFNHDFSKAYAYLKVDSITLEAINMFHIHCGRPGQPGSIIVDLGMGRDIIEEFAGGELFFEIDNEDIVQTVEQGPDLIGAFTAGCALVPSAPADKVKTVAGMAMIAFERELYFNLSTNGQSATGLAHFGDIRGQLQLIETN